MLLDTKRLRNNNNNNNISVPILFTFQLQRRNFDTQDAAIKSITGLESI